MENSVNLEQSFLKSFSAEYITKTKGPWAKADTPSGKRGSGGNQSYFTRFLRSPVEMPDTMCDDCASCMGIRFGDVDWTRLPGGRAEDSTVGLLGGGGADNKKSFKPSTRSRAGILQSLHGGQGVKVVCNSLATGHQVAKKIEALETASETASVTTSEAASSHPAYFLNTSLESADGNFHEYFKTSKYLEHFSRYQVDQQ